MQPWFHDPKTDVLVYPHSDRLLRALPEAKQVQSHIAVPRTLEHCQVLRWLDYPVVPIMDDYDWPCAPGFKPLEHQKIMANFMVLHPKCFNLSDMGTMKTLATLWALDWLMRRHADVGFAALIVAPLSTLQRVWGDSIFKHFLSRRSFRIIHGSAGGRCRALAEPADYYIINFDGVGIGAKFRVDSQHGHYKLALEGVAAAIDQHPRIRAIVVDEASAYRDSRTKRHRIARHLFRKSPYLWLLSGTPTPHAPTDAYGLAKLVNNADGMSFTTFQRRTMVQVNQFRWVPQSDGYERARELLTPSIRYDIKDVWDGPEFTTQQREAELTSQQIKLMKQLKRSLTVQLDENLLINAVNEAVARTKYLQISLGAIYDSEHDYHEVDAEPRWEVLKEILEQAPSKVLIFAGLTSVLKILNVKLRSHFKHDVTWGLVNGETSAKERNVIFRDFQHAEQPRLLLADPRCMAHGLDLFAAQTIAWYGPTDSAEIYAQANRRAHRPGQRHPVTVVQIVSNPLEREIYRRLESNLTLQGALLELVRRNEL